MTGMKKIGVLLISMMALTTTANAQDNVEANISADLVSNYIFRGAKFDNAAVQPTLGVSYKGLSLSAWGSYGLEDDPFCEFDFTLAYSTGGFNIGITDYWNNAASEKRYFYYPSNSTAHVFEGNIGYDFGPVSVQWYTNFAGADGVNKSGKRAYSSYCELNAPFKLGGLDWKATLGAVPYATTFYPDAQGFAVTNVSLKASKDIKVTDSFSIPLFAQIVTNPSTQKAFFVVGLTIQP